MELSKVEQSAREEYVRVFQVLGNKIVADMEESREKSLTITKLEECLMWFERAFLASCMKARQTEEVVEDEEVEAVEAD